MFLRRDEQFGISVCSNWKFGSTHTKFDMDAHKIFKGDYGVLRNGDKNVGAVSRYTKVKWSPWNTWCAEVRKMRMNSSRRMRKCDQREELVMRLASLMLSIESSARTKELPFGADLIS